MRDIKQYDVFKLADQRIIRVYRRVSERREPKLAASGQQ
jgi:hypothetical protein